MDGHAVESEIFRGHRCRGGKDMTDKERIAEALRVVFPDVACPVEGRQGEYVASDGTVVRYFQSNCSEEAIIARMITDESWPDPEEERREFEITMRRNERVDGYKVRKELGDKLVNLGRKVNKIPA